MAVVTGASAGVGKAIAVRFARDGWKVGLIARDPVRLAQATAECVDKGSPRALSLVADVADWSAVKAAAEQAERDLGPVDVWINSAMATVFSPVSEMTPEEYRRVSDVTYLGQVHGTLAILPLMRARGRGTVIFIGSALAYRGLPLQSAYSAAKFAVRGFFEALRAELMADNSPIHIGMVQMPAMNTPQFDWARSRLYKQPQPVPPIFQPEPCANAVLRAVRLHQREVWVGRSSIKLIAAAMILPGATLDRMMARVGISGQYGDLPADSQRADNLDSPVPGPAAARGRFDAVARRQVWSADADRLRTITALAIGGAGLAMGYFAARRRGP
ncbi:MAG: SDR family oxidoreductase [Rhodospirillaceae bacterium]